MTLLTGFSDERQFIDELLRKYKGRRPDAAEFAERARVLLLESAEGIGIDIALGALPFEELAIARAIDVDLLPGRRIRLCSPEDLIVHKVFAGREKDWRDVEMTIVRQGDARLDWRYIVEQLGPLLELKSAMDSLERLKDLRRRASEHFDS